MGSDLYREMAHDLVDSLSRQLEDVADVRCRHQGLNLRGVGGGRWDGQRAARVVGAEVNQLDCGATLDHVTLAGALGRGAGRHSSRPRTDTYLESRLSVLAAEA